MKKLLIIPILLFGLTASGASTSEKVWTLETGLEVFEFTPQTAPHMQCIFVSGYKKAGLDCFTKNTP